MSPIPAKNSAKFFSVGFILDRRLDSIFNIRFLFRHEQTYFREIGEQVIAQTIAAWCWCVGLTLKRGKRCTIFFPRQDKEAGLSTAKLPQ